MLQFIIQAAAKLAAEASAASNKSTLPGQQNDANNSSGDAIESHSEEQSGNAPEPKHDQPLSIIAADRSKVSFSMGFNKNKIKK